jgi:hypothetical protein
MNEKFLGIQFLNLFLRGSQKWKFSMFIAAICLIDKLVIFRLSNKLECLSLESTSYLALHL